MAAVRREWPVGDNAMQSLGLGAFLVALAGAVLAWMSGDDFDPVVYGFAWLLLPIGLGFLGLGGWVVMQRPRRLVFDAQGLTIPALPAWKAPRRVAWAEIAGLAETHVPNLGPALTVALHSGEALKVPLAWLTDVDGVVRHLQLHLRWAAAGDPAWALPAWERLAIDGGFGFLARPDAEPEPVESWGVWAAREDLEGTMLVLGRPAPAAALECTPDHVASLLDDAEAAAAAAGMGGRLDRRNLALVTKGGLVLELFAVLRKVSPLDPTARQATLLQHFTDVLLARRESEEVRAKAADLEAVRDLLRVELSPEGTASEQVVRRSLGGGVTAVLTFDHEHGRTQVTEGVAAAWAASEAELFELATANLRGDGIPTAQDGDGFRIYEGPLAGSLVLGLDAVTATPEGAVVAVPHQDLLLVMDSALQLIMGGPMAMFAQWASSRGHRPVSPHLYLRWKGELHLVELRQGPDGRPTLVPPPLVFGEVLEAFTAGDR